jgi:hypothetical protein
MVVQKPKQNIMFMAHKKIQQNYEKYNEKVHVQCTLVDSCVFQSMLEFYASCKG